MKITLTSILVDDQSKACEFYTQKLDFEKKEDVSMGEHRWLTVVSKEGAEGVELLLEPLGFEPAATYQKALFEAGIPAASFETDDIQKEVANLKQKGVDIMAAPKEMGNVIVSTFNDTCGNIICLVEKR